jgi:hypothetical protein
MYSYAFFCLKWVLLRCCRAAVVPVWWCAVMGGYGAAMVQWWCRDGVAVYHDGGCGAAVVSRGSQLI